MSVAANHVGPWTVADLLNMEEDRRYRYELLDGTLMMSPSPGFRHQRASRRLANLLETAAQSVGAPVEIMEAVNVELPSELFIPDIAVVEASVAAEDPTTCGPEAVWMVVEIVSPSTKHLDRRTKPIVYAEAGIDAYWRLELEPTPTLIISTLDKGVYTQQTTAPAGTLTNITNPFPLQIDPGALTSP